MSVLAGVYSLRQGLDALPPETATRESIVRAISRQNDEVQTWSGSRFFLAKIDVGVFPDRAFLQQTGPGSEGVVASLAGHPYLAASREAGTSRHAHLAAISRELNKDRFNVLRDCYGAFALCHYRQADGRLILSTDRVGSRPLYYFVGREHLVFSTMLRVLEEIATVPKRMDIQGIAERVAVGFPLGARTQYADIRVLKSGEYLCCEAGKVGFHSFFEWDKISPLSVPKARLLERTYETFVGAVARRSADESTCVANLSGGLDSRCVVTALHTLKKNIYAITWAMEGMLDTVLAQRYAQVLGVKQVMRRLPVMPDLEDLLSCFVGLEWPGEVMPPRPNLIFSGDGGSVGLGHVYLTEQMVGWMRERQTDRVIDQLARGLPRKLLRQCRYREMQDALVEGLREEFESIRSYDPGRDLHIFYLKNDQRRHLYRRYENIDRCRVEYLLPFFDGPFLELIIASPVDWFLLHRFYNEWLGQFGKMIVDVPWQAYPGHLGCPLPMPTGANSQWQAARNDRFGGKYRKALHRCAQVLLRNELPTVFLRRSAVAAAIVLHGLRLRNCGGLLLTCADWLDTHVKCAGAVVEPESRRCCGDWKRFQTPEH